MKLINKTIYALALVGMMGLGSCSSDEMLQGGDTSLQGHPVSVTLTVSRGEAQTRTTLSENDKGGITSVWETGDRLHVYNSAGEKVGILTISDGVGTDTGVFFGSVEAVSGNQELSLWYYDEDFIKEEADKDKPMMKITTYSYGSESSETVPALYMDLRSQNFKSAEDFKKVEVLSKKIVLHVNSDKDENGNNATVVKDETLKAYLAFARFSLKGAIPEKTNGKLDIYDIAGYGSNEDTGAEYYNTYNQMYFDFSKSTVANSPTDKQNIVVDNVVAGEDVYVALVPKTGCQLGFIFTAENKDVYKFGFDNKTTIYPGRYYNSFLTNGDNGTGTISGVELPFEKEEIDDSDNPGNLDNWSGEDSEIVYGGSLNYVSDAGGWTTNIISIDKIGGWATLYTYKQNAIVDGLLSSTNDGAAFYYQWGRWLGFPSACVNTCFSNEDAYGNYPTTAQNLPGNPHNYKDEELGYCIGYTGDNNLMVTYCSGYMGANSNFNRQKAIDWSIMFAMVSKAFIGNCDYIYANEDCTWEERSGNPCPDNYRLPTVAELSALIPSVGTINSTYSEFKEINGVRYAMKWTKGYDPNQTNYVDIQSVNSNAKNISDVKFEGVRSIRLYAYGFIDSRCNKGNKPRRLNVGSLGMYWSNESGDNTLSGTNGKGAKYLSVIFDGSKVNFSIRVAPRTFGGCVIPFKDSSAKSASVTPWLPYCGKII